MQGGKLFSWCFQSKQNQEGERKSHEKAWQIFSPVPLRAVELLVFHLSPELSPHFHVPGSPAAPEGDNSRADVQGPPAVPWISAFLWSSPDSVRSDVFAACSHHDKDGEAVGDFCRWEIFLLEMKLLLSSHSGRISKMEPDISIWKASPVLCNSTRLLGILSSQISPHFPMWDVWSISERGGIEGLSCSISFDFRVLEIGTTAISWQCGRGYQGMSWMLNPGTVRHHGRM